LNTTRPRPIPRMQRVGQVNLASLDPSAQLGK
jgi:hypothetical protein